MAFTESMWWTTNGQGDGPAGGYGRNRWAELFRSTFGSGVLKGEGNELKVSGAASPLTLATGAAYVDGIFGRNPGADSIIVTTPSVGTTGCRLVLRATWGTTQTLRAVLLRNNDGVPLATQVPDLTQDSGSIYEIPLARFDVTVAGVIQGLVNEAPLCQFGTDIADGAVVEAKLGAKAVTGAKLGDKAVGAGQLADGAVTSAKIQSGAVGTAQLGDGAVTNAQVAANAAIAQSKISNATRAIDAAKLEGKSASDFASKDTRMYALVGDDDHPWAIPGPSASWSNVTFQNYTGTWTECQFTLGAKCDIVIQLSATLKGAPGNGTFDFRAMVDSTATEGASHSAIFTGALHFSATWPFPELAAGTHKVKIQMRHDQGNAVNPGIGERSVVVTVFPRP